MPEKACEDVSRLTLSDEAETMTYMLDQAFLLLLNLNHLERMVSRSVTIEQTTRLGFDSVFGDHLVYVNGFLLSDTRATSASTMQQRGSSCPPITSVNGLTFDALL